MIPVKMQPEPSDFFNKVQEPGERFLTRVPEPRGRDWRDHDYWTTIIPDLYEAYNGICAYTCHWIPLDTGSISVDHFKPKGKYPQDAYRWANYRLACGALNGRKGEHEDVLDPFTLQNGWFAMDFPSLLVKPGEHLLEDESVCVHKTIKRLKLNGETCVRGRQAWLLRYLRGGKFEALAKDAPFIASELKRQKLAAKNLSIWKTFK